MSTVQQECVLESSEGRGDEAAHVEFSWQGLARKSVMFSSMGGTWGTAL